MRKTRYRSAKPGARATTAGDRHLRMSGGGGSGAGVGDAGSGGDRDGSASGHRRAIYDEVTQRICAELEAGRLPWVQPWRTGGIGAEGTGGGVCLPRNAVTARAYSGINVLLLWGAAQEAGYASQGWLTFRQALAAGGSVRKGEKGTGVVYADRFTPEAEKARASAAGEDAKSVAFLKRFTVFNVAQCEGLPVGIAGDPPPLPEREVVPVGEALIAASGVEVRIGGGEAFYAPGADFVQVPPQQAFPAQIDWYRTAFHELAHATGHTSRLGRQLLNLFGSKDYAREELVAEMGAAFLCASLGIVPTVRHADYIGAWLAVLREENRAIFRAASAASKAADWLLARPAAPGRAVSGGDESGHDTPHRDEPDATAAGLDGTAEHDVPGEGAIVLIGEDAA